MHHGLAMGTIAATTLLCACGGTEGKKADSSSVAQTGAAASATSKASFDASTHTATIHARDFAFDAPDSVTAGWTTFHLVNDGPQLHHAQLVRLDSGKTTTDLTNALKNPGPPPAWAVFVGGTNAPNPGGESSAVFNLEPGNYAMICMVDIPDHVPHVAKGMMHALRVTPSSNAAAEPTSDITVALADYSFTTTGTFTAGKHTVKIVNNGPQPHELELVKLQPGKTPKDVADWFVKMDGPPPVTAIGGVAAQIPKITSYAMFDLTPGKYVLYCFVPDGKDGKAHAEHGMFKEITIN
ncbi:MAG: hypothetical protein ABI442_00210 [Gemmatimonadaceae bacterium]